MSAIAALIASVAAPLAAVAIARINRDHELALAREERGFDARRAAFEDTLTEIGNDISAAQRYMQTLCGGRLLVDPKEPAVDASTVEQWNRARARIATVASPRIMAAYDSHADAQRAFWGPLADLANSGNPGDVVNPAVSSSLEPVLDAILTARRALEEAIREDIRGS